MFINYRHPFGWKLHAHDTPRGKVKPPIIFEGSHKDATSIEVSRGRSCVVRAEMGLLVLGVVGFVGLRFCVERQMLHSIPSSHVSALDPSLVRGVCSLAPRPVCVRRRVIRRLTQATRKATRGIAAPLSHPPATGQAIWKRQQTHRDTADIIAMRTDTATRHVDVGGCALAVTIGMRR